MHTHKIYHNFASPNHFTQSTHTLTPSQKMTHAQCPWHPCQPRTQKANAGIRCVRVQRHATLPCVPTVCCACSPPSPIDRSQKQIRQCVANLTNNNYQDPNACVHARTQAQTFLKDPHKATHLILCILVGPYLEKHTHMLESPTRGRQNQRRVTMLFLDGNTILESQPSSIEEGTFG